MRVKLTSTKLNCPDLITSPHMTKLHVGWSNFVASRFWFLWLISFIISKIKQRLQIWYKIKYKLVRNLLCILRKRDETDGMTKWHLHILIGIYIYFCFKPLHVNICIWNVTCLPLKLCVVRHKLCVPTGTVRPLPNCEFGLYGSAAAMPSDQACRDDRQCLWTFWRLCRSEDLHE